MNDSPRRTRRARREEDIAAKDASNAKNQFGGAASAAFLAKRRNLRTMTSKYFVFFVVNKNESNIYQRGD
jgi:hypothetical protein